MNQQAAIEALRNVIRRKHLALSTEQSYCGWLARYCEYLGRARLPAELSSERKMEAFLTMLARTDVSASTQNQAFNALLFFYEQVTGRKLENVQALRAKKPMHLRRAPEVPEVKALLAWVQQHADFATNLNVRLLYGCGLRVSEPLNLRVRDVELWQDRLIIRAAKGGKDRMVAVPCSCAQDLQEQMETARAVWRRDQQAQLPVALPHLLAKKYPQYRFNLQWAWLFPANHPCRHPRTGELVRWRWHEANVQRAVRRACRALNLSVLPHELRHAYATHCLNRGTNPRAIQEAMGHQSLETTMGYLHAEALSVQSPLDPAPGLRYEATRPGSETRSADLGNRELGMASGKGAGPMTRFP